MDLNIQVRCSESNRYRLKLNVCIRYILPGYSFPGTAGIRMSSKSHSRTSADIRARRHIGIGLLVIHIFLAQVHDPDGRIDAPDFYESLFWKDSDPKSGLGGWGDPNADYQVPDGGFHTLPLSYPSPHTVRRNFTLVAPPFPGAAPGPQIANNASFSASVIESILKISPGDYKQFQTAVEKPGVSTLNIKNHRLLILKSSQGPHGGVHIIMGG